MNSNDTKTLWIALGAAVFAVFLLYSWMQEKNKEVTNKFGKRTNVVVAKKDINEMYPLDETAVEVVEIPEEYVGPQAVTDPSELRGYVALAPMMKGEQILKTKISKPGALTGLSYQISPGKRALTIPIDAMRGVAHLLKPGDRVDLVAAVYSGSGQNQKKEIKVLMQNTIVLATGTTIQNELPASYEKSDDGSSYIVTSMSKNTNFSSITIEATPSESQKLIYILSVDPSSLFLILRHPSDTGAVARTTVDVNDVLGRGTSTRKPSAAPARVSRPSGASTPDMSPSPAPKARSRSRSSRKRSSRFKSL